MSCAGRASQRRSELSPSGAGSSCASTTRRATEERCALGHFSRMLHFWHSVTAVSGGDCNCESHTRVPSTTGEGVIFGLSDERAVPRAAGGQAIEAQASCKLPTAFPSSRAPLLSFRSFPLARPLVHTPSTPRAQLRLHLRRAVSTKDAAATAGGGKAPSGRKSSSGGGGGCEFYKGKRKGVLQLKEVILDEPLEVRSISNIHITVRLSWARILPRSNTPPSALGCSQVEEVVREGRLRGACPYYASRAAVAAAHVVFAPYTALLHTETREALGLRLEGNVVIVDEAHNLAEAVASTYSAVLTERQLAGALFALQAYLDRFRPQLAAANLRQLALLESLAKAFMKCARACPSSASGGCRAISCRTCFDSGLPYLLPCP